MSFSRFANVLWAAGFVGNAGLLSVLVIKKWWRQFPVFTVLAGFELLQTATLFCLFRYALPPAYYWGYWVFAAIDCLLQILLLLEIASVSLRPRRGLLATRKRSIAVFVILGMSFAASVSMAASPPHMDKWDLWEVRMSLFSSLLMCELCAALSAYANRLGLQWRTHVLAIAQGYTVWAIIAVIGDIASAATGWHRNLVIFDHARMITYIWVLVYWTWVMSSAEEKKSVPDIKSFGESSHTYIRIRGAL